MGAVRNTADPRKQPSLEALWKHLLCAGGLLNNAEVMLSLVGGDEPEDMTRYIGSVFALNSSKQP